MSNKKRSKAIISITLSCLMAFSGASVMSADTSGVASTVPSTDNAVISYGSINPGMSTLDQGWDKATWNVLTQKTSEDPALHSNTGAKFKALWDENYIYVLTQVDDTNLDASSGANYEQDSVEVFVDIKNDKTKNRSYTSNEDFQFRVNYNNVQSFDHGGNTRLISAARINKDSNGATTGYTVESVFYVGDVTQLSSGKQLGFDVQVNNGVDGSRHGQWFWHDGTGMQYQYPSNFGTASLDTKPASVPARVDKLKLFQALTKANSINKSAYGNASILNTPVANANDMYYNNQTATQANVDACTKVLTDALNNLERSGPWPDPKKLSKVSYLPDLFTFMDGKKVTNTTDWKSRQQEIASLAEYYEYGYRQPAPTADQETFTRDKDADGNAVLKGSITINGVTQTFSSTIVLPDKTKYTGNVPVVVNVGPSANWVQDSKGNWSQTISYDSVKPYNNNGIATASFRVDDWGDQGGTKGIYYKFFPRKTDDAKLDVGSIMAWSWGYSRIVDGLLAKDKDGNALFPEINPKGICVTGFSYQGKFALAAGAFDTRTAVTIPCNSGEGGVSNWRKFYNTKVWSQSDFIYSKDVYDSWKITDTVGGDNSSSGTYYEHISNVIGSNAGWFKTILGEFQEDDTDAAVRLPFDQHSIIALCASQGRSIMIEGGFQDWGTNPKSMIDSYMAAKKAFDWVGDSQGIAITFDHSGHMQTDKELTDITNYINYRVNGTGTWNSSWQTDPYSSYDETTAPWSAPVPTPVISVKSGKSAVKNGGISASNVTVSVSDLSEGTKEVTLNGKTYGWPSNGIFTKDGKYAVTVKDQHNHVVRASFIIDKTAPKIDVKRVKGGATITVIETNLSAKAITLNGKKLAWPRNSKLVKKGTYVITVTDKAGHKVTRRFKV